jgi:hypothetical protein
MRSLVRVVAVAAAVAAMVVFWRTSDASSIAFWRPSDAPPVDEPSSEVGIDRVNGSWSEEDWGVFASRVRQAEADGLRELPPGEAIGRLAESFVGTPYTPGTLEADGPEGLVINFREFDCVTFVENMLAMTRFIRSGGAELLDDRASAEAAYERHLESLRYRHGRLDGYPSRLHYFSEWLADNASRGLLSTVTSDLDPAMDLEPIDFMSTHADAYRQLADPGTLGAIEEMEARLNAAGARAFVRQDRIGAVEGRIRTGDVIAATSTVEGLDIAHTGLAIRIDGRLHMIHAPLVGSSVEISEVPLVDRILGIPSQDGIMVARWADGN